MNLHILMVTLKSINLFVIYLFDLPYYSFLTVFFLSW